MKKLLLELFLMSSVLAGAASAQVFTNIDDSLNGWKPLCYLPACDPGGSGQPTSESQTIDNNPPSKDGESMELTFAGPAYTNVLAVFVGGQDDKAVRFKTDVWFYVTSPAAQYEFDQALFSSSTGIEFMWGFQCDTVKQYWEIWNSQTGWVDTPFSCTTSTISLNTWHHLIKNDHRVAGDTGNCDGEPCMYFDNFVFDTQTYTLNTTEPAGPLPKGWKSALITQFQMNTGSEGGTPTEYVDLYNFSALETNITPPR